MAKAARGRVARITAGLGLAAVLVGVSLLVAAPTALAAAPEVCRLPSRGRGQGSQGCVCGTNPWTERRLTAWKPLHCFYRLN